MMFPSSLEIPESQGLLRVVFDVSTRDNLVNPAGSETTAVYAGFFCNTSHGAKLGNRRLKETFCAPFKSIPGTSTAILNLDFGTRKIFKT